jgi:hypothetical protein
MVDWLADMNDSRPLHGPVFLTESYSAALRAWEIDDRQWVLVHTDQIPLVIGYPPALDAWWPESAEWQEISPWYRG